jgi:hypothetical protein
MSPGALLIVLAGMIEVVTVGGLDTLSLALTHVSHPALLQPRVD